MGQKVPLPSWLSDMAGKFMLAVDKRPLSSAPSCISTGLLECPGDMAGGFLQSSRSRAASGSGRVPCDLALEVIHRHFRHIVSVAQLSPEQSVWKGTTRGHEYQEAGSPGPVSEAGSHASQSLSPHLSTLPTTPPISNSFETMSLACLNVDTLE